MATSARNQDQGGVAGCLTSSFQEVTMSPTVARWSSIRNPEVGRKSMHVNDPQIDQNQIFGITSSKDEGAAHLVNPPQPTKFQQALKSSKVARVKVDNKAPKVMEFLPPETIFGIKTTSSESAADALRGEDVDVPEELVVTSKDAGFQTTRGYVGSFDKMKVMGKSTPCDPGGGLVAKTLEWRAAPPNKTRVESDVHRAFKAGEHRAGGEKALPANTVFGAPSPFDGLSVGTLMTTSAADVPEDESYHDDSVNTQQLFGVPTIRSDIHPPARVSVSDSLNYGDQGEAATVLNPSKLTLKGISLRDATTSRSQDEIRTIFNAASLHETLDFDAIWARAAGDNNRISINQFQEALLSI